MNTFGFGGTSEVTCGGNALKFYASMRLNIKRIGLVKRGEEVEISLCTLYRLVICSETFFCRHNSAIMTPWNPLLLFIIVSRKPLVVIS